MTFFGFPGDVLTWIVVGGCAGFLFFYQSIFQRGRGFGATIMGMVVGVVGGSIITSLPVGDLLNETVPVHSIALLAVLGGLLFFSLLAGRPGKNGVYRSLAATKTNAILFLIGVVYFALLFDLSDSDSHPDIRMRYVDVIGAVASVFALAVAKYFWTASEGFRIRRATRRQEKQRQREVERRQREFEQQQAEAQQRLVGQRQQIAQARQPRLVQTFTVYATFAEIVQFVTNDLGNMANQPKYGFAFNRQRLDYPKPNQMLVTGTYWTQGDRVSIEVLNKGPEETLVTVRAEESEALIASIATAQDFNRLTAAESAKTAILLKFPIPSARPQAAGQQSTGVKPKIPIGFKIFLSYRRSDSNDVTGRIYDRLEDAFGREMIFKDVDSIPLGVNFADFLKTTLDECNVVLAIIGPTWLSCTDSQGYRRLDDPGDFVRLEVETALKRKVRVIPLLVSGASMPGDEELPNSLKSLIFQNAMSVRPDPDFHRDMDRLINQLQYL